MVTEDYVSFETAKLLKDKGFDVDECEVHYDPLDHTQYEITLQMATKWLREVHNLAIVVTPSMFWGKYNTCIYEKGDIYPIGFDGDSLCPSYEQAAEVAIKYCLENLI